jgi:hypothetical protein
MVFVQFSFYVDVTPGTHWIGGWVGPEAGLVTVEKRKILTSRELNPDRPARRPSLYQLSYPDSWAVH